MSAVLTGLKCPPALANWSRLGPDLYAGIGSSTETQQRKDPYENYNDASIHLCRYRGYSVYPYLGVNGAKPPSNSSPYV